MKAALKIAAQQKPAQGGDASPAMALAMGRALTHDWNILAMVPVSAEGLDHFAAELERLSLSRAFDNVRVIDTRGLPAETRSELVARMSSAHRNVLLVDPPEQSVLATLLCAEADGLLLLAREDTSTLDEARAVVERCGRNKFVGSFLLSGEER